MANSQTRVLHKSRPIRLAFFVNFNEDSHPVLDAVFDYCYSIWGGRFSLIIPCVDGMAMPEFLPWLKAFDPDAIYSYVDLTAQTQLEIHENYCPAVLHHHRIRGGGENQVNYRPDLPIPPLGIETLLPIVGKQDTFDGSQNNRIIGAMGRMENDQFLADSFGFPRPQLRNSMRNLLAASGSMVLVIADDEAQPRQTYVHEPEITLPEANALLSQMASNRQIRGVAQISAFLSHRLDLHSARWGNSFNIVVGDAVSDRVLYWNTRSLMPSWRDGGNVDLRIPRIKFEDPAFITSLREFINRRNYVNAGNGNSPYRATLRSISLPNEVLQAMVDQIRQERTWIAYSSENVTNITDCVPEERALEQADFRTGQHGFHSSKLWTESFSIGNELRLTATEPEHLRHIPSSLLNPSLGAWAVDLDIERNLDHSPYSNVRHRWRLPRRLRVTQTFLRPYQLNSPHGAVIGPRVSSGGLLTLYANANVDLPKINIPTDSKAIVYGLQSGRDWMPFERFRRDQVPIPQLCYEASRSSAGRHFWGVYQLFGGMNKSRSFFLHEFWRKQLESYGATDQRTDVRQERMQAKLTQRIGPHVLNLANDDHLHRLSDIVLQEADSVRTTVQSLSWTDFDKGFKVLTDRYNQVNLIQDPDLDLGEEARWQMDCLRESVEDLCGLGVLHQGYEHKCRKCLHRSWISITDLKSNIECEVCHDVRPAPVSKAWQFRLNGFLREALQRHGVGPLFWVLSRHQKDNNNSFWFEGPLDIFFSETASRNQTRETDIDLTMIDNGLVRMCEVKQSERQFRDPAGLARTMAKLRPDIAMIAVMETVTPALQRKFSEFSDALMGTGIKPELLTLDIDNDIEDSPYF